MVNLILVKYKRSCGCIYIYFEINQHIMTAMIFPGQGSQSVGMSKDFYDNFKIARNTFEEIQDYTNLDLKKIIFENQNNSLDITNFTQISIFTASMSIFKTIENEKDLNSLSVDIMLGHSLGEYTSLACSQKINLKETSIILKNRGELMNNAVSINETGMAALIGCDSNTINEIITKNKIDLEIANDNSPIQVVVSGKNTEIDKSKEIFLSNNVKRFVKLNVSAAFHSKYMNDAQKSLSNDIEKLNFQKNNVNIISNYTADISSDNSVIKMALKNQMANKVRWTQSIKKLEEVRERKIIEIGPSNVLSGLIKRISNKFDIVSINNISDIEKI